MGWTAPFSRRIPPTDYKKWGIRETQYDEERQMADPLSLTASIITVLGVAGATAQAVQKVQDLRNAPLEVVALGNEITDVRLLFKVIENTIATQSFGDRDLKTADGMFALIERSRNLLEQIQETHQRISPPGPTGRDEKDKPKISKRLWLKEKKNVAVLFRRLRETRHNLQTAISAVTCHQTSVLPEANLTIQTSIQDLQASFSAQFNELRDELATSKKSTTEDEAEIGTTIDDLKQSNPERRSSFSSSASTLVGVTGCQTMNKCQKACPCHCHVRTAISFPPWVKGVLGSLFLSYAGSPWSAGPNCNYVPCKRSKAAGTAYTYHFPSWMVAKAIFFEISKSTNLSGYGSSWTLHIPKVLCDGDPVWRFINHGTVTQIMDILSQKQVSACDMNRDGKSLLHFAVEYERPDICRYLLSQGVSRYFQDDTGFTAPMMACEKVLPPNATKGRAEKLDRLREVFQNDDLAETMEFPPLTLAILRLPEDDFAAHLDINFASINAQDTLGRTPLIWTAALRKPMIAQLLIDYGADSSITDKHSKTALHWAVISQCSEVAQILVKAGANLEAKDVYGRTPMHEAAKVSGSVGMITLLTDAGACIDAKDAIHERTPLYLASYHDRTDNMAIMLEKGACMESLSAIGGQTPLLAAVAYNCSASVEFFLSRGANLHPVDLSGRNILHLVAKFGSATIMRAVAAAFRERGDGAVDPELLCVINGRTPNDYFLRHRKRYYHGDVTGEEEACWMELMRVATGKFGLAGSGN